MIYTKHLLCKKIYYRICDFRVKDLIIMATANDEKVLDQVGSIWKFLDTMSVSNPEEYNKFIDKVMKEGSANNLGPPVPKIVIQTEKVKFLIIIYVFKTLVL